LKRNGQPNETTELQQPKKAAQKKVTMVVQEDSDPDDVENYEPGNLDDEDMENGENDLDNMQMDEDELEGEEDYLDEEDEEDDEDLNIDDLTEEEYMALMEEGLLGGIPAYFFQTPKERKKYFEKLNSEYYTKLAKDIPHEKSHAKKVKFNIGKSQIIEFDHRQKVSAEKIKQTIKSPAKGLLKKSSSAEPDQSDKKAKQRLAVDLAKKRLGLDKHKVTIHNK